jgi:hypothetical protein
VLTFAIAGFCSFAVNPFGPVQAYVTPGTVEVAESCRVWPAQIGLLPDVAGAGGTVVRSAVPVSACASGFVTVTSFVLHVAPTVEIPSVTCVGVLKAMELTVTPPLTEAAM